MRIQVILTVEAEKEVGQENRYSHFMRHFPNEIQVGPDKKTYVYRERCLQEDKEKIDKAVERHHVQGNPDVILYDLYDAIVYSPVN